MRVTCISNSLWRSTSDQDNLSKVQNNFSRHLFQKEPLPSQGELIAEILDKMRMKIEKQSTSCIDDNHKANLPVQ
jgi:hypothetical protein